MIRTISQLSDNSEDWNNILLFTSAALSKNKNCVIHYLNEPERQGATPQEAAKLWREKIVGLRRKGVKFVGPACASDGNGEQWIREFLTLVKEDVWEGEEPDFLGVHYYGESWEEAVEYLKRVNDRFPERKMVASEIGCTSRSYEEVVRFTGRLCNCKSFVQYRKEMFETSWACC